MKQAVILAGGAGTRLASRLNGLPKPLIDVDGLPLLGRQLQQLAASGFNDVVVLVNYKAAIIEAYCDEHAPEGVRIRVFNDGEAPRGTAGATFDARRALAERFVIVYGDTMFDVDLNRFWSAHEVAASHGACATLFLHPNDHPHDSDLVAVGRDGYITAFYPKPHRSQEWRRNLVNAALYVVERAMLEAVPVPDGVVDFGRDFFPAAVAAGCKLRGYISFEYIKDVGTPERLDRAISDLRSGKVARARLTSPQKAVFLDRDGTLNVPAGHISKPDQLKLFNGVGQAIGALNKAEYRCVMVTNQPVIARGECTEATLDVIHAKLETLLGGSGAFLDASYVCPHHTDAGFPGERPELKFKCDCRKPRPGMIDRAVAELHIDRSCSWMVGDSDADVGAARAASVASILICPTDDLRSAGHFEPDFKALSLLEAVAFILHGYPVLRGELQSVVTTIHAGQKVKVAGDDAPIVRAVATTLRQMLEENGLPCGHIAMNGRHVNSSVGRSHSTAASMETDASRVVEILESADYQSDLCFEQASFTLRVALPTDVVKTQTQASGGCIDETLPPSHANSRKAAVYIIISMLARHNNP